ncbi:HigA family addiction module antitoxin [Stenoxybacter acetivorans]|uniref:HigA family addiction module antitoxin n=1 Tax=Stenoxybacter acetivorans TaxID=422441 RepID=UPI00056391A7|nr:HigA family addiction module antitoxin [Stenoxybacter acetivorans]
MGMHNPAHPGLIIREYLTDTTITELARHLGVTRTALSRVINGKVGITPEMAMRLSIVLNTGVGFWIKLQANYDAWQAEHNTPKPENVVPLYPRAVAETAKAHT